MFSIMRSHSFFALLSRCSIWTLIGFYFVVSTVLSYGLIFIVKLIDAFVSHSILAVASIDVQKTNKFFHYALLHPFSTVITAMLSFIFLELSVRLYAEKHNPKNSMPGIDATMFPYSVALFAVYMILTSLSFMMPEQHYGIQMFSSIVIAAVMVAMWEKSKLLIKAIDMRIEHSVAAQINRNMAAGKFTTFIMDPIDPRTTAKNMIIQCTPETYDDFHLILKLYTTNVESCKMMLHYINDKKLHINKKYEFVKPDKTIMSKKDFLKDFYDYVSDANRLNSNNPTKEFLGL